MKSSTRYSLLLLAMVLNASVITYANESGLTYRLLAASPSYESSQDSRIKIEMALPEGTVRKEMLGTVSFYGQGDNLFMKFSTHSEMDAFISQTYCNKLGPLQNSQMFFQPKEDKFTGFVVPKVESSMPINRIHVVYNVLKGDTTIGAPEASTIVCPN